MVVNIFLNEVALSEAGHRLEQLGVGLVRLEMAFDEELLYASRPCAQRSAGTFSLNTTLQNLQRVPV